MRGQCSTEANSRSSKGARAMTKNAQRASDPQAWMGKTFPTFCFDKWLDQYDAMVRRNALKEEARVACCPLSCQCELLFLCEKIFFVRPHCTTAARPRPNSGTMPLTCPDGAWVSLSEPSSTTFVPSAHQPITTSNERPLIRARVRASDVVNLPPIPVLL